MATTTENLCEATGLGRSSIYNGFTSKRALFVWSLTYCTGMMARRQLAVLGRPDGSAVTRLQNLLASVVDAEDACRAEGCGIGCLGVNSTTEVAGSDPEVVRILRRDLRQRLAAFCDVIAAGQLAGEVSCLRTADALALYLNVAIAGMRVSAQIGADRAALEGIAAATLDALAP
ncbi:TetR/AcrR family transcriptional regulator [Streptomyces sp. NPDC058686]|uniref:TetR/AcrR family transcriptional regulator n=1 Tax=Streptomyces sp. NPDC058686 TaxID=3346599 RepID=UPI00365DA2F1